VYSLRCTGAGTAMSNQSRRLFTASLICLLSFSISFAPATAPVSARSLVETRNSYFAANPYVQPGYHYSKECLAVSWITEVASVDDLIFEYKPSDKETWQRAENIQVQELNGHPELHLMTVEMKSLPQDVAISYRITKGGKEIFQASVPAVPSSATAFDFAVAGDIGHGSSGESKIAAICKSKKPSMFLIPGDIVYPIGSVKNYLNNFFPYLNADGGRVNGSSILQSTLTFPVAGNHDLSEGEGLDARDLDLSADSMSYYVLWKAPLNGPLNSSSPLIAKPRGSKERIDNFLKAAGEAYPRMTNYSFDYGMAHFLVLDGNSYTDWTDAQLRKWVDDDLKNSKARWKFVVFHQPGFNSDWAHREEQRMRHLCDIFEQNGVDVCFSGHSHSYQRTYPLRFKESQSPGMDLEAKAGYVWGTFKIDKTFDGNKNKKPNGIVYVVSGGGGAKLSLADLDKEPGQWLPFTQKFMARDYSITICHLDTNSFKLDQIAVDGSVIDHIEITK
jgi:hypothetical protein